MFGRHRTRRDLITEEIAKRPAIRVVGLLGGVASGKSFVAALLADLVPPSWTATGPGMKCWQSRRFEQQPTSAGEAPFSADGSIDRRAAGGKIVFADTPQGRRER